MDNNNPTNHKLAFWCHICKFEFSPTQSINENSIVSCPKCNGEFCEEISCNDDNPKDFIPYESENQSTRNTNTNANTTNTNTQNNVPPANPITNNANTFNNNNNNRNVQTRVTLSNPVNQIVVVSSWNGGNNLENTLGGLFSNLLTNPLGSLISGLGGSEDTSMNQIIQYLMENDPNRYGPPPASKQVIDQLPVRRITKELMRSDGFEECSVCKEEFKEEEEVKEMPCNHLFHNDCLLPWLNQHNSCPTCRFELPTDDIDYENRKAQNQRNHNSRPQKGKNIYF